MDERVKVQVRLLHVIDRPPLQHLYFLLSKESILSAMAKNGEVDNFKRRVQESLDHQREKSIKKYERMLENFKRAVDKDGMPRLNNTVDYIEFIQVKDDAEEAAEAQSEACAYTEVFTELYLKHIQHLRVDVELFYDQVMEKLTHKAGQCGIKNSKGDETQLLELGYLPTTEEWKRASKTENCVVTLGDWLRKQLPQEQKEYVSSIKIRYAADLKRAKLDQLRSRPYPKPMLKRQNGYLGFVYTVDDEPLMIEVLDRQNEHFQSMVRKLQEKSLKRKIKQEPDFVGLPIKKEKIEEKSEEKSES